MAAHLTRITNDDSISSNSPDGYVASTPGKLIMDADAFIYVYGHILTLEGGPWTATINGKLNWNPSANVSRALYLVGVGAYQSSVTIGATATLAGYDSGVSANHATNITNKGTILGISNVAAAIGEYGDGDYKIVNSGTIVGNTGIYVPGAGTHTIVNSGSITAATHALLANLNFTSIEKVTNSGVITGDINLGAGNDSFTNFINVKVKSKVVTKHGAVDGSIDLGNGGDTFKGGNNAETVKDGNGADSYKLGGGNDTFLALGPTGTDGTDTVDGGAGSDTYDFSGLGFSFTVNLDKVAHGAPANRATYVFAGGGTADNLFNFENALGGGNDDTIYGNAAANFLSGGDGNDTLYGFAGNDILKGNRPLDAGHGNDFLYGGDGNDAIDAGGGADHVYGGSGRDIMTGGSGDGQAGPTSDTFVFSSLSDSGTTLATRDVITDFNLNGDTDFIDLSAIDADTTQPELQHFNFIGLSQWGQQAGELRYVWTLGQTIVEADVDGDAKADFSVALDGHLTLTAADFSGVSGSSLPSQGTAPTTNHITNDNSGDYGVPTVVNRNGPGNLIMDADAWLLTQGTTIVLQGGSWTGTIDGKVTSANFSGGGNAAIDVYAAHSTLTIGASAEISGYTWGIISDLNGTDIVNKGNIVSQSATGYGILETRADSYTINNSGTITAANVAIDLTFGSGSGGTHTIVNSGTIDAPTAIAGHDTTKVTNSGTINGDIQIGNGTITNSGAIIGDVSFNGNESSGSGFTNFAKVKINGKVVTKYGTVDGTLTFANGDQHFNGGNNAERVQDGRGQDTYRFGGGDDIYLAAAFSTGDAGDTADGGTGRDTYDFSATNTAFVVNLDRVLHGTAAANTATFISGINGPVTEKIFNFEDVLGSSEDDIIYGSASANYLDGGSGNDNLYGLSGNDVLDGGSGSDDLYGGAGRDILTGNMGSGGAQVTDTFHFQSVAESGVTAATRDVITDFISSNGAAFYSYASFIDLSAIDAVKGTSANEAFTFIGQSKWHNTKGELRYVLTSTQTIVEGDVNGDGKADFSIALEGQHNLQAYDFIGVLP